MKRAGKNECFDQPLVHKPGVAVKQFSIRQYQLNRHFADMLSLKTAYRYRWGGIEGYFSMDSGAVEPVSRTEFGRIQLLNSCL